MATGYIFISPNAGVAPSASPALWKRVDDTNLTKTVIEYADASENYDWVIPIPGDWASGGTLRIQWRTGTGGSTTNAWHCTVTNISRADTESSDATLSNSNATDLANASATSGILNVDTLALTTTGWGANEQLHLRMNRNGADAGDTLTAVVIQVFGFMFEYTTT